jgi:hypothetical protein
MCQPAPGNKRQRHKDEIRVPDIYMSKRYITEDLKFLLEKMDVYLGIEDLEEKDECKSSEE